MLAGARTASERTEAIKLLPTALTPLSLPDRIDLSTAVTLGTVGVAGRGDSSVSDGEAAGGDVGVGTVWLTYSELAAKLGVELASAQRRALRAKWPRRPGNDGRARVGVPPTALEGAGKGAKAQTPDRRPDTSPDIGAALQMLQGRLVAAEAALAAKTQELAEVREDRARLAGEVDGLKVSAEHLHEVAATARREAAEAQQRAAVAELEAGRLRGEKEVAEAAAAQLRARGLLARLWNR